MENNILFKNEYFQIIGICMEVHRTLKGGLAEIIYKDALEFEFKQQNIPFEREKSFEINYKGFLLPHKFYADFIVLPNIILELKAVRNLVEEHTAQTLNYMRLAKSPLGILVNFGNLSLEHKRLIF